MSLVEIEPSRGPTPRSELLTTMPKSPQDILRPEILALTAYHVPDARGMLKLDAMENPYTLPDGLQANVAALARAAALNRYPDPAATDLKVRLREAMAVPPEAALLVGNGSDEIIQMLAMAVARPGAVIMGVEPSFVMFRMIATFCGVRYAGVPLEPDFTLSDERMLAAIEEHQPALIFIAYPNNPTGNLFDARCLERIIDAAPGLVVIDEAYHAFARASFMPQVGRRPNLLVMRTLSKLGLAGLRLGLVAGPPGWLEHVDKVRLPYNVNVLTQSVAAEILGHPEVLEQQASAIRTERERLSGELSGIQGAEVFPSAANFILFRIGSAGNVFEALKQQRVLIKNLHGSHPALANCLRVTVGTPDENRRFVAVLRSIVRG